MNKLRVKIGCPTDTASLCEKCHIWHPNYTALAEGERERIAKEWVMERLAEMIAFDRRVTTFTEGIEKALFSEWAREKK